MEMNEARHLIKGSLRHDVDMSRLTSWRVGGKAQRVYQPTDSADLAVFLRTLAADEPLLAVGLGSNLLVRDGGLRGTVLLLHAVLDELRMEADDTLYAQAGVSGAKLARFAAQHNRAAAEFFAGIPGTLGGMLAMNAGCYGSETWGVVERVQVMTRNGELIERAPEDYAIGYRQVALRAGESLHASQPSVLSPHYTEVFIGAWLKLPAGDGAMAREAIKTLLAQRIASQPLNLPNAGSVFRNPPHDYAARLIESCGLKGRHIGGAQVSEKHANFIVNLGTATAADIENLINEMQATVKQQTGIKLHPEVRIIGEAT